MRITITQLGKGGDGSSEAHNRFSGKCKNCGATNTDSTQAKCAHCEADLEFDPETCTCKTCQDGRAAKMGLEILDMMKRKKAARQRDGVQTGTKTCQNCNSQHPASHNFCQQCGTKL